MDTKQIHICPNCDTVIEPGAPVHIVRKGPPRFKTRVSFLNMAFLTAMMVLINFGNRQEHPGSIWWSGYVGIGLWLIYLLGVGMKFRSEVAWLIVPAFFLLLSIFIAFIDVTTSTSETILFNLSWSYYPIVVILILLIILPIVTFTGRKERMPLELLKEIVYLDEESKEE